MKKMSITFNIFSFDELSKEAQDKAINDYVNFLVEITDLDNPDTDPDLLRAFNEAERMQTPWFTGSYVWEYCQKWILEDLRNPEQFYLENGEVAMSGGESVIPMKGEVTFPEEVQS